MSVQFEVTEMPDRYNGPARMRLKSFRAYNLQVLRNLSVRHSRGRNSRRKVFTQSPEMFPRDGPLLFQTLLRKTPAQIVASHSPMLSINKIGHGPAPSSHRRDHGNWQGLQRFRCRQDPVVPEQIHHRKQICLTQS